ncbi:MAG: hypothetical protein OYL92_01400 [Acidobacteriota bacterium]|nr:hypothetical protein [Acidobacteriota bacterium]MDE3263601.1 hypothetical protein [Acidobacteriota bacterium]
MAAKAPGAGVRYEADERTPTPLAATMGLQYATLCVAGIVLTPAIIVRAAGGSDEYLAWAVFAAIFVSGIATILQAVRLWRIGAGYILLMGTSGAFIAVSIAALSQGGPMLLAKLVIVSSLFQFLLSARLLLLRRLFTTTVTGTVIMLISVSVMPIMFNQLTLVPDEAPRSAGPITFVVAIAVMAGFGLRARGIGRLWAPVAGVVAGSVVAAFLGLYDFEQVAAAAWIGAPAGGWPGFDLSFGPAFWALLPGFVIVTLIGAVETIGDAVGIQRVSWRTPRAPDYRAVQGAVAADGLGNLLSGIAGTVPNTTYSSSISVTELTGVASRRVGMWIGIIFLGLAFLPKALALILAIPGPVVGAYGLVLIAILFVLGARIAGHGGIDYRKALVIGVSFWIGVGFENDLIFSDQLGGWAASILGNGMTAGGLTAIVLTAFLESTGPRRRRLEVEVTPASAPRIGGFLRTLAERARWTPEACDRLWSAGEEALLSLAGLDEQEGGRKRSLLVIARVDRQTAELEFVAAPGGSNIEDRLVVMAPDAPVPIENELSLRLLRHVSTSVQHQQYHDTDVLTVKVSSDSQEPTGQVDTAGI